MKKIKEKSIILLTNEVLNDNSRKLVSEYDKVSFDKWMSDLIKKNGITKY